MRRFFEQLEARVSRLPGVGSVAAVNQFPLNGALASADYKLEDRPPASDSQLPTANYRHGDAPVLRDDGHPARLRPRLRGDRRRGRAERRL
jgi:hypothetical protein